MKKIVIVAGDKSGDMYGGLLCKRIKEKYSDVEITSFGGLNLAQHSEQLINITAYAVTGLLEVVGSLKTFLKIFKKTVAQIQRIQPNLIILIDFPDFNLRLAKILNKRFPLFYYISPQVWAWRKNRIALIKKYVDKMVVIFKFEVEFYRKEGIEALYFGHPLLELIEKKNVQTKKIVSFMPGSRLNEIKKHLPLISKAKRLIQENLPDYHFRIIRAENIPLSLYQRLSANIEIINHSYEAIQESEFIITSSGTATVEIAILEVPFLIVYKLNPLTWHIGKRIVKTKFIGMVNILSSKKIVEELLQNQANPKNVALKTLSTIKNKHKYQALKEELKKIKELLKPYGATDRFAEYIGSHLGLHRLA
jgi:lipid-A-disaccharide synthase